MRGGNVADKVSASPDGGLSPHARGKLEVDRVAAFGPGPIPACAGETDFYACFFHFMRAYPRMRGGNCGGAEAFPRLLGLSPHARGKPRRPPNLAGEFGPIPACAGETRTTFTVALRTRAYPRMRGGNGLPVFDRAFKEGLSPHARGKPGAIADQVDNIGPIPACAGETAMAKAEMERQGAYPRMRGGNSRLCSELFPAWGLSPHARGKPCRSRDAQALRGPIPACAGETFFNS